MTRTLSTSERESILARYMELRGKGKRAPKGTPKKVADEFRVPLYTVGNIVNGGAQKKCRDKRRDESRLYRQQQQRRVAELVRAAELASKTPRVELSVAPPRRNYGILLAALAMIIVIAWQLWRR